MADDEVRRDRLSRYRTVLQRPRGHRSGTDDVVAAWSAWRAAPEATTVLDLGAGHGTVTLLLSQLLPTARFLCVEAQQVSAELCRRNLDENGLSAQAEVVHADLRSLGDVGRFDLVTGTPPFMRPGSGVLPQDPQRAAARFELRGGIEDYCIVAARHGERVSMVMDGQEDRARAAFRAAGLGVERVVRVSPRLGRAPTYVACAGGPGAAEEAAEELVVREGDGWSPAWARVRELLALD